MTSNYVSMRTKHATPDDVVIMKAIRDNRGALPAYGCNTSDMWQHASSAGWIWLDGVAQDCMGTPTTTWKLTPMGKWYLRNRL